MTRRLPLALAVAVCVSLAACSKDSNPSTPSTPAALRLSFTGTWPAERVDSPNVTGNGNAMGLVWPGASFGATDGKDAGAIWIAVKATGANVGQVRGEIRWNPAVLRFDAYSDGEWFKQGGALVEWTLLTNTPGQVGLQLNRPTTLSGATGTGTVVYLRLRAVAAGTTPLQWSSPELRGTDFSGRPLTGGTYDGSVTVQ